MKKQTSVYLVLWLTLVGLWCSATAQAAAGLDRLQAFNANMKTFQAAFTQELVDAKGAVTQTSSGKVYLQRPGRFRWDYQSPFEQEIVADGEKVWIYDVDLEQVTVKRMNGAMAETPAMLLIGKKPLEEVFDIRERGDAQGMAWVQLLPKSKDSGFEELQLGFDAKDLRAMELIDSFGQVTRIQFKEVQQNIGLPADLFKFTPPKGVDVVGELD